MVHPAPVRFTDPAACVEATLSRVGRKVVLGLPVAIGKPNPLANAFVQRALADPSIDLTIVTALSLRLPKSRSDLERRFLQPFLQRVFGDYLPLDYVRLIEQGRLPGNIQVIEFFLEPGGWLRNDVMQRHYLSANYTHVARDAILRGLNVVAQLVAAPGAGEMPGGFLSLGSNPDLTADLLPQIAAMRARNQPFALIGQVHREMPFMYGDALVTADSFDFLLDDPAHDFPLFCPPNTPISTVEHSIALNVSALIRDCGTLQLGIGELGDAMVYAMQLRHQQPAIYRELLESNGLLQRHRRLIEQEGGTAPFERGLYGCSEMLVDGFLDLYRSDILKRRVYPSAPLQRLLDEGHITEEVSQRTLDALSAAGMKRISYADFNELRDVGVFRDDVQFERGALITPDGVSLIASLDAPGQRAALAQSCLGEQLRNGVLLDAGFFFGPKKFYAGLRDMPAEQRRLFAMRGISFVNELYGHEWELKVAQRRHARFINTTMMVTGLGAAISDGLEDGRVVSGVGGQYNFVAMAHALPEARSILCLRSTRTAGGKTTSNIRWSYGYATIPRHLRDIFVTEYGIADLRGKTDQEVVTALIGIMDARFQDAFVADAKQAGKLPADYRVPEEARSNLPELLATRFAAWQQRGLFGELPFGSDFTNEEITLSHALQSLGTQMQTWSGRWALARAALKSGTDRRWQPLLERMSLAQPGSLSERLQRRLLVAALRMGERARGTLNCP